MLTVDLFHALYVCGCFCLKQSDEKYFEQTSNQVLMRVPLMERQSVSSSEHIPASYAAVGLS
jgi:hypothetical protein